MFRQIVISLLVGFFGLCGIIGIIGCDNFEDLLAEIIDPDPIEAADNEWGGTWALESYQGLTLLETVAEYDDYDDEDFTFFKADGSVVESNLREQAIAAFWSGEGVTGYDGSISYSFHVDGNMEIEIVIHLELRVEGVQGVLVGRDKIQGSYSLIGSTYTTEIADEVETGTWQQTGDILVLNPEGGDGLTVLQKS